MSYLIIKGKSNKNLLLDPLKLRRWRVYKRTIGLFICQK